MPNIALHLTFVCGAERALRAQPTPHTNAAELGRYASTSLMVM